MDESVISTLMLHAHPEALQLAIMEANVTVVGYFYAVDFGSTVKPQQHRVGKNAVCSCYLAERCPAVEVVQAYLERGGARAPEPPAGYYPVCPAKCPICGSQTAYEARLSSKRRGAGWRCLKGGTTHYWERMGQALAGKFALNPWLFPALVLREGVQCLAWDGIQDGDQVLHPGIRRSETISCT